MGHRRRTESQEPLVVETFDREAPTYAQGYLGDSSAAHSFNVRLRRVYELLHGRNGGRVLDVGCGPGITVDRLVESGFEVYGVDISPAMIDQCRRAFAHLPTAHFSVGRIERLDFPDAFFDVVLCMGVVEYVDDDRIVAQEMARVTKPGGTVIITCPNRVSPFRMWQRTVYRGVRHVARSLRGRPAPIEISHREYSDRSYMELLASCGLRATDVVFYNFSVLPFPIDRLVSRLGVRTSCGLERLGRSGLRWLGTGFIVSAEKM